MGWILAAVAVAALALIPAPLAWRGLHRVAHIREREAAYALAFGVLVAFGCGFLERWFWRFTGLSVAAADVGNATALWAMLLFVAPLEEAAKLLVLWPFYSRGAVHRRATGLVLGCAVGAGFAAGEVLGISWAPPVEPWGLVRVGVAAIAHPFFAALWGQALGSRQGVRWFPLVWLLVSLFHGLFDHIVFGRGPGFVGAAVPIAVAMLASGVVMLRSAAMDPSHVGARPDPRVAFRDLGRTLRAPKRPASLFWSAFAGLVTTGVVLTFLGLGVYFGHRIGLDFSDATEENFRSNAPIVLLAVSAVTGFPFAGYLVAKASSSRSLLEPALGAVFALGVAVIGLYVAAPIAVIFAIAAAPVAFLLACVGAWFGMER